MSLDQQDVYLDDPRNDVSPWIPAWASTALDVGCGKGGFGRSLRSALGDRARIVAVEPVESQAAVASVGHGYDEVHTGFFPEVLGASRERFDLICFVDVLEHMPDPWRVLIAAQDFLTENGRILAAIPNVQYAPNLWGLARGRWEYTDTGILDRTHIRFFTRSSMIDLFRTTGYEVEVAAGANNVVDAHPRVWRGRRKKLRHLLGNAQWLHFIVVAKQGRFSVSLR